jgi:hypothetical protein
MVTVQLLNLVRSVITWTPGYRSRLFLMALADFQFKRHKGNQQGPDATTKIVCFVDFIFAYPNQFNDTNNPYSSISIRIFTLRLNHFSYSLQLTNCKNRLITKHNRIPCSGRVLTETMDENQDITSHDFNLLHFRTSHLLALVVSTDHLDLIVLPDGHRLHAILLPQLLTVGTINKYYDTPYKPVIRIPIRCLLDPWIRDGYKIKIQIQVPGWTTRIIFPSAYKQFYGLKIHKFYDKEPESGIFSPWIQNGKIRIWDKHPDPQHCLQLNFKANPPVGTKQVLNRFEFLRTNSIKSLVVPSYHVP